MNAIVKCPVYTVKRCPHFRGTFTLEKHSVFNTEVSFLLAEARTVRERLVLRLLYVFRVCLLVCLFVCLFVRPHLSCAQYVTSYVTMQLQ